MDSKSIARKGVPVRLRDPVLNPDETFGFVGVFLSAVANSGEGSVRRTASRGGGRAVFLKRLTILAIKTIATEGEGLALASRGEKKGGTARNGLLS